MTTVTTTTLVCACGHSGAIKMRENDAPFSRQYEDYSLVDLDGESFSTDGYVSLEEAIKHMRPQCPKCGSMLSKQHVRTG
jgi:hypothetical protein